MSLFSFHRFSPSDPGPFTCSHLHLIVFPTPWLYCRTLPYPCPVVSSGDSWTQYHFSRILYHILSPIADLFRFSSFPSKYFFICIDPVLVPLLYLSWSSFISPCIPEPFLYPPTSAKIFTSLPIPLSFVLSSCHPCNRPHINSNVVVNLAQI